MPLAGKAFDWRAFWADLLQGAGRGLLILDGSDAAQAAIYGLDHFEAAQRRRAADPQAERAEAVSGLLAKPRTAPAERQEYPRPGDRRAEGDLRGYQAEQEFEPYRDPLALRWTDVIGMTGLAPSVRPHPLSANPYDELSSHSQPMGRRYLMRRYARPR